jgi:hypothetical protein
LVESKETTKHKKVLENVVLKVFDGVAGDSLQTEKDLQEPETRVREADDSRSRSRSVCF